MTEQEFDRRLAQIQREYLRRLGVPIDVLAGASDEQLLRMVRGQRQPPHDMRAQERLDARRDRRCTNCGATFTPKNSLGRTCSTRCRVALHRKRAVTEAGHGEEQHADD